VRTSVIGGMMARPARLWALAGVWVASAALYYFGLLRPYGLQAYLPIPGASPGTITDRDPWAGLSLLLFFVMAFGLHAAGYALVPGSTSRPLVAAIVGGGILLSLLLLFVYPIGANDVFNYMVQGELLVTHGLNPMVYPASHIPDLPLLGFAAYRDQISPYGPVWTWLEALVVLLFGAGDLLGLTVGFKLLAFAGYGVTCWLLVILLRRRAPEFVAAGLLIFAWNPLVLFETAANAHADIWIGAAVLAAVLLWEERRRVHALAVVTLSPLIKAVVAPLVPLFAIAAWSENPPTRRLRFAALAGLVLVALVAASYLTLPQGLQATGNLLDRDEIFTHSLPSLAWRALQTVAPRDQATRIATLVTMLVFALYSLRQIYNAYRAPGDVVRLAYNMLLFLLLVCMPWFQPWYLLWVIPLAAIRPRADAPLQTAIFGMSASLSYIVYGFLWFIEPFAGDRLGLELAAVASTFALSWAYAAWAGRSRRTNRGGRRVVGLS
jgi:alpha-1,6-mannosyltransferase